MKASPLFHFVVYAGMALGLVSCSSSRVSLAPSREYGSFPRMIPIPPPGAQLMQRFSADALGEVETLVKNDTLVLHGVTTRNREFLDEVITPILTPHIDALRKKHPTEIINALALFGHEVFRTYFGRDFYRWAGDINDLDDPQERGVRAGYRYGLDCSGFASLPYELAVHFNLIDSASAMALFSSKGFARFCRENNVPDRGGRNGTSNRFRLDTDDLHRIGKEVFTVPKGGAPTSDQMKRVQPGDLVGRDGHVGILVEIEGDVYYLESGGWVVPRAGGFPCHAMESIEIFARNAPVSVRRALPDR